MPFIGWWAVEPFVICIAMFLLFLLAFRLVRRRNRWLRWPVRIVSVPAMGLAVLATMLVALASGCQTNSELRYSPRGDKAIRVEELDGGAVGGDTAVFLYTDIGLRRQRLYSDSWKSVEAKDVHWTSESQVTIAYYSGYSEPVECSSTTAVTVTCNPRPQP